MADGKLHIVVFPWLAFGHMLPFLELSKSLAKRGHHISFLSTPRNIQRLPKIPPQLSPLIDFVPLTLPPTAGLPDGAEATSDLPPDQVQYLKKALDGLKGPLFKLIKEAPTKPDWIIQDFAQHWLPGIASEFGVPCIFFSIFIASALAFFSAPAVLQGRQGGEITAEELTVPPNWVPFPSKVAYRLYEARWMVEAYKLNASGVSDARRLSLAVEGCQAVALRSCNEFEADWLPPLQEMYQKPVLPVGLLPPLAQEREKDDNKNVGSAAKIMEWLDQQGPKSVLYVAFGSEARLSSEHVHELALGIELSKLPFIWALRNGMEFLPEGFEDRNMGRGVIAMGWIPQLKVLAHESVGGFLTHCGWSSVIESLQFGHPLILLPIFGDQGLNARVMEEKKIGLEVKRNEEDGSFTREEVARALRLVMVEEEGEPFKRTTEQMKEIFTDEACHEKYVDDFDKYMRNHRINEG